MALGIGFTDRYLTKDEARKFVADALATLSLEGKRVLVLIPDGTRSMPMPLMFDAFEEVLLPRAKALDYLVALGTHPAMNDTQLSKLVGRTVVDGKAGGSNIFNHHWEKPETFVQLGTIPSDEISTITGGLLSQEVPVKLNRMILDYDQLLICGPVFPHEVVGFSGGNKYFYPGIGGAEIINFTHWLGAVITSYHVIGAGYTPVRAVIDRAAAFVPRPVACFAVVVTHEGIAGIYFGSPAEAWDQASQLSAKKHIVYVDKPFRRVLAILPELYDDLWTGAKGAYKMEPAMADGGEVVIFSPHITEVSYTHGKYIDEIGYHCRDYFMKQWDKFKHFPGGVLAHSTHVVGLGEYDAATGIEKLRIHVTLATGIPEERCRRINLGYLDPNSIRVEEWAGREREGIVVIPRAGETLYRLKKKDAATAS
jgi:nickel-dependent lactate racemase